MTTRGNHPMGTLRRIGHAALALSILIAAGGCAVTKPAPKVDYSPDGKYRFEITFDERGCPISARAVPQNCSPVPPSSTPPKDCARVLKGDTVEFVAITQGPATPTPGFLLQFDPFKKGTFKPPSGGLKVDAYGIQGKPYTFNVLADPPGTCTPLDPQIIVD